MDDIKHHQSTKVLEKSWKLVNRELKEKRKKWREKQLMKKARLAENLKEQISFDQRSIDKEKLRYEDSFKVRKVSTVSIAVPGSILDNAQTIDLRYKLASQIARAACIYKVDEIVVYDDQGDIVEAEMNKLKRDEVLGEARPGCLQLARLLQYCECPQYLRKNFFPQHRDLERAGILDPLHAPHHLRMEDGSLFREGIVTNKPVKVGKGSLVNVGLSRDIRVDKVLESGLRVTVKIPKNQENRDNLSGTIVSPTLPKTETGIYWGYTVRMTPNISEVFANCPYPEGYDLSIGTSDKGSSVDDVMSKSLKYNHALIVFGGLSGIEAAVENDSNLNISDASLVFHKYLNTCPNQGSRTIRTEEAVLITLAELRSKLDPEFSSFDHPQFNPRKKSVFESVKK
ncbi:putative methyltransferase C9orf114 homolog [Copidosoma floridanum]|uniref:putative methyltransferase C9orf114 homolog n=1 Tax=Copidosoma floridanum TaxID=29053 RepID=UPI0006C9D81C|nr:putative methyltransferase C9orf114 homolog [Copidosoma floridanum]